MKTPLTELDARIIGCLLEKEVTTPEQYPLSLNAICNACNQKSNRDPVMEADEPTVQKALDGLMRRGLVSDRSGYGGRVAKYKHRFCNTDFRAPNFTPQEVGVLCVLMLRGPQTPGELRTRTHRLCTFIDVDEVDTVLAALMKREDGPFVAQLARASGARESRFAHLFCRPPAAPADGPVRPAAPAGETLADRVARLERELADLRQEIAEIRTRPG